MSTPPTTKRVRTIYEFIKGHRNRYSVQFICRVLDVAPSGDYGWLQQPLSNHAQEEARLLRLIQTSFTASHGIYGARACSWICGRRERLAASTAWRG